MAILGGGTLSYERGTPAPRFFEAGPHEMVDLRRRAVDLLPQLAIGEGARGSRREIIFSGPSSRASKRGFKQ